MIYKIELKISGLTVYTMFTTDLTQQELEKKKDEALELFRKQRFTKNLLLEVVATPK